VIQGSFGNKQWRVKEDGFLDFRCRREGMIEGELKS
jgi:hypothetical protein